MRSVAVGIDVGGTFTDAVMIETDGQVRVAKTITTKDQSVGAVDSVAKLGVRFDTIQSIVHGTTVATNAILERKGAAVGLLTTEGFRDLLEFQRQERRNIWDLFATKPEPLVPRRRRLGVKERIMANGEVREALDLDEARRIVARLRADGSSSIAVCFLNSYVNGKHEEAIARLLEEEAPDLYAVISSRVAPHFREYDRLSTTVVSAYVGPKIAAYLSELRGRFSDKTFKGSILVMGSHGGVLPPEVAAEQAAITCLSGPAGGVIATIQVAAELRIANAISFDMGGTSTDVSLVQSGRAAMSKRSEISGLPISLPQIHIETVSAGGGSIASIDSGGLLHVGPDSAGSNPGPACYGFGGASPTVTDAAVLVGLLRESTFFGGALRLNRTAAEQSLKPLAARLQLGVTEAAEKVLQIANHKMANAVRIVSLREGHDPRDYALFAFGGAGPLHACAVADDLRCSRVIVPMHPGAFSAFGLLCADLRRDFVHSLVRSASQLSDDDLLGLFDGLVRDSGDAVRQMASGRARWLFQLDARYRGQAYEVAVGASRQRPVMTRALNRFHILHKRQFGFSDPAAEVEIVNVRAIAVFPRARPVFPSIRRRTGEAPYEKGPIFADGRLQEARFFARENIPIEGGLEGPLVIEEATATTYIPEGWQIRLSSAGHVDATRVRG
jgi:N-methylhydantoinase A